MDNYTEQINEFAPQIRIGASDELSAAAGRLRQRVFIDEQGVPEDEVFDGLDSSAFQIVMFEDDEPVATARLLKDGGSWRIGLVAVDKSRRGQHLGEKVMKSAIEYISSRGGKEILLSAQQQAAGFYEKLGFEQCDDVVAFESGFVLVPMKCSMAAACISFD